MNFKRVSQFMPHMVAAVLLLPMTLHAIAAWNTRLIADDYCYTLYARDFGVFGAIDHWYHTWTGIYSAIVLQGFVGLNQLQGVLPGLLLLVWFIAIWWVADQAITILGLPHRRLISLVSAACLLFAIHDGSANIYQSLYWTAGAAGYTVPLMIFTFYLGLLLHVARTRLTVPHLLLAAGMMMLGGGYSALFTVFQLAVLGLIGLAAFFFAQPELKRRLLILIGVSMVFSLIAIAIIGAAPGNAIRQAHFPPTLPIPWLIMLTLTGSFLFLPTSLGYLSPVAPLLTLTIFAAVALNFHSLTTTQRSFFYKNRLKFIGITCVIGFLLINASFFPAIYVFSDMPQARAYVVPQTVLIIMLAICGYLIGLSVQFEFRNKVSPITARIGWLLLLVLLIVGPIRSAVKVITTLPDLQTFATEWDTLDQYLKQNTGNEVEVTAFTVDLSEWAELQLLPEIQETACFKDYYGITIAGILD